MSKKVPDFAEVKDMATAARQVASSLELLTTSQRARVLIAAAVLCGHDGLADAMLAEWMRANQEGGTDGKA